MPFLSDSGPFLAMQGPFPAAAGGSISLTSGTPTVSGTEVTFPATSSGSLVGYAYGVEFGIGISAGYTDASSVAGAATNQSIMVDIAGFAGSTTSVVNARTYYNADPLDLDPADRVYGSAVPVVVNSASETGTETEGQTLTGAHGVIVGPSGMTLSQAWQRCDSGGANCSAIAGETATTYVLAAADVGNTIKFQQTATNGADSDTATSAASGVIAAASSPLAFDAESTATQVSATSITWTHTPSGTPTKVFACVSHYAASGQTVTGVTYGGVAMALVGTVTNASAEAASIYSLESPSAGAQTVIASFSASALANARSASFVGGDATAAIRGTGTTNSGASTAAQVTQTSNVDDIVLAFCVADDNTTTLTAASGETARGATFATWTISANGVFTADGSASVSMDVTLSTFRQWGIVSCSVKGS